jgi:hypothetical protein
MRTILNIASLAATVALFGAVSSASHAQLWYNGDFNGQNGLANEKDAIVNDARVYDDFIIPVGQTWTLTSVFSNDLSQLNTNIIDWEIRSGVSAGNGGTLIASGSGAGTSTPTGRSGFGLTEIHYQIPVNVVLGSGMYWLMVRPDAPAQGGRSFVSTTSGANSVGSPAGNDNKSYFTSPFFGANFTPASGQVGVNVADFSMGVNGINGSQVPEPGAVASLVGLATTGLTVVWRRRRSS